MTEKATIEVPVELKDELKALKADERDTYAGVIKRLVDGRVSIASTEDAVTLSRKTYNYLMVVLPSEIFDKVREGVR